MSLLLLLSPFFIILLNYTVSIFHRQSLPPGPTPWPVIGNMLQLHPKKLHISMAKFAQIYGPLFSLRLGSQLVIVASSPSAASEVLKTHDRLLCGRFVPKALPRTGDELDRKALIWNPNCSNQWKLMRTLSRTELFSVKAIESQAKLREKKLKEMIEFLKEKEGKVVNIGEVVFANVFNTISNLLFSNDLIDLESGGKAKSTISNLVKMVSSPNIADFYPWLEALDLQGLKKKMRNCLGEIFGVWETYIKERRERSLNGAQTSDDFLDVFLANGFDDDRINILALEFFTAGTDTITTTIEWAMTEILKNEQVMKTLREELDREINDTTMSESVVSQLPYLNACVKETLRLHPPVPFLLPHRSLETCKIMNYVIPKHAQVLVNVWAIGRDSSIWDDPLSFKPKRFLTSNKNFKGHDFEFIPFGSGRRICPGLPMAVRQLPLILGYLLNHFHWSLPKGNDLKCLNTIEKFDITLQKEESLQLIPHPKF